MIKNRFLAAVMAVLAGVAVVSCDEVQEIIDSVIEVSISAENDAFDDNGAATVKLSLNAPSNKDISVILGISSEAQTGYTAVISDALEFEGTVKIPAGTEFFPVTIKINDKAEAGQQAVITIVSAAGATVGKDASAYIKVPASYSGDNGSGNGGEENKTDLSGANVWSIIGAFNNWAGDVELTKTGNEEWKINAFALSGEFKFRGNKEWGNYDLGAASGAQIVYGQPLDLVHKGQNITIAEGVYDIVLYPTELKAVFSPVETPPVNPDGAFVLDWTVKYNGSEWVPGYYSYGQLELFEVSNTNTEKFYHILIQDLTNGDDDVETLIAADAEGFFASIQEDVEDLIEEEMEEYDETREEAIPWVFYNEINDGTDVLFYGLPAGKYQFVVLSMDDNGILDKGYSVLNFEKAEDALEVYDWNLNMSVSPDWTAEWDGWIEGYEGKYYYIKGNAPGAGYVLLESFTDDELEYYAGGDILSYFNSVQTSIKDGLAIGYDIDELLLEVEADGLFEDYLSTYGIVGETHVYIAGFDAQGNILSIYGDSVVDIPEYVEAPVDWVERTDWAVQYDATVDTGDEEYSQAVVATACDAPYFIMPLYGEGALEENGIDEIGKDATSTIQTYIGWGYTIDELVDYEVVYNAVPAVSAWKGLYNGVEAYLIAIDANGKPTGEWHMEVIEGVEEVEIPEIEMTLVDTWSVTPVGSVYEDDGDLVIDVEVNAPDIKWYTIEENSDEDLDTYYGGSIAGFAAAVQEDIADYLDDYTMDEILWSNNDPETTIVVYNTDVDTNIYIVEFDENGLATGRYGATAVNIPSASRNVVSSSAPRKIRLNVVKDQPVRKIASSQKTLGKKVRKNAARFDANRPSFKASAKNQAKPNLNNKHVKLSK